MEGRRFGLGLAAGLIFAVAVVAAVGGMNFLLATPTVSSGAQDLTHVSASTSTATSSYSTTFTYTHPPSGLGDRGTQGNISSTTNSASSTSQSTTSASYVAGSTSSPPFFPSASLAAISTQGAGANAILAFPIVVAILIAAVIYRASSKRQDGTSSEPKSGN